MNIFKKECLLLWRSPQTPLLLAVLAFCCAWIFWQMIDRYVTLQDDFTSLSVTPFAAEVLWQPFLLSLTKVAMILLAMSAGRAIAEERAEGSLWYVQSRPMSLLWQKWLAQWSVSLMLLLLAGLAAWTLNSGVRLLWPQIVLGVLALILLLAWLKALGILLSCYSKQSGGAILLCLVVFSVLWLLGDGSVADDFGANWIALFSPQKHFAWLLKGDWRWVSIWYFIGGTCLFMYLSYRRILGLRYEV